MPKLSGKTIWLTGASSGIGEAVAHRLGRINCRLALSARRTEELERIAEAIRSRGGTVEIFPADVTDRESLRHAHTQIIERLGEVDILFTCAGTYTPAKPETFDSAEYERVMQVNYTGSINCVDLVLPSMMKRKSGHLVIVSSIVAYRGLPNSCSYGATKAALCNFFEGLRFDVAKYNIDVSIVNPGFVRSRLTDLNEFPMPFRIEPDEAAEHIVAGMRKGSKEIHFPWQFTWLMKLLRILPYPIYEKIIASRVAR